MNHFVKITAWVCLFFCLSANAATRQMEYLDRGLVAVKISGGVYLSWRYLGTDDPSVVFNLYRNGTKVNNAPITTLTNYTDAQGTTNSTYTVKTVVNGVEQEESKSVSVWAQQYKTLNMRRPAAGTTPDGNYTYTPNDCSVGDVDGDGEYEIIVKWDPSNAKDNSQSGYTGNVYLDCYKLNGTFLWRIDLGKNIRAGAHYTQFMVYDLDGDGKAELVCKTAPGTIDGKGKNVLMGSDNPNADYRNSSGYILTGPEYLTVFEGLTGGEMNTIAYNPARGTVNNWGDNYGNRVDRFLACVAYLDGVHPSVVMCRGYYTRSVLVAYDLKDGKLVQRWIHDSNRSGQGAHGEGYHNISVADVDGDGLDEIIYGSASIDHDGKLMYRTGYGHGDAMHVSDLDPSRPGLEGWFVHEDKNGAYGYELRDLKTGQVIWGTKTGTDNGRGMAADIDAKHSGFEMWSSSNNVSNSKGQVISNNKPSINFRIYWDGDLQDELLDGTKLDKWNGNGTSRLFTAYNYANAKEVNGTKANPCLSADILGDWREEMIFYNSVDPSQLVIFTTVTPTTHRLFTLMHDPVYRMGVAWQNVAYNQPPHLGFYIGDGLQNVSQPDIYVVNPNDIPDPETTLTKQGAGSSTQTVELGNALVAFSYAWTNAASVLVEGLPQGVTAAVDDAGKTVSISGTPTETGTFSYTVTTTGSTGTPAVKGGVITVENKPAEPPTIGRWGSGGERNQQVIVGNPIKTIVFNFTNATSVKVNGDLPAGITADIVDNQLQIGGTPRETGVFSFSLETVGGTPDITAPGGTITVIEDETVSVGEFGSEASFVQVWLTGEKIAVTIQSFTDNNISLELFDVRGYAYFNQHFHHSAGKEKYELDRSRIPAGVYLLVVKTADACRVEKILLKQVE